MNGIEERERELETALAEQARVGESYRRAVGTSAEFQAYLQLRSAGERVAACDRRLRDAVPVGGEPLGHPVR